MYKPIAERKREPDNIWCSKVNKSINQTQAIKTDHVATIQHDFFFFPNNSSTPKKKKKKFHCLNNDVWLVCTSIFLSFPLLSFHYFSFPLSLKTSAPFESSLFLHLQNHTLSSFVILRRTIDPSLGSGLIQSNHSATTPLTVFFFSPTVAVRFSFSVDPLRSFSLSLSDTMWIFFEPRFSSKNVSSFPDITEWFGL